ncbi:MAG: tRNA guanosine(34) transglycosylase Tgt [Acidimicrobiales bacterium]|nr:tRNA guanosine(34) transglycosylase Tgt [Acidimicrobiales bacterium]
MKATFVAEATDGSARAGVVHTARGQFATPCFMPVGTRGAVKHLSSADLEALDAQVVLANTYHLMLRPGADVVEKLGGLHRFADWDGHTLTDSGGYQIFSLEPKVDDEGALFKSTYDGSRHKLTPESAAEIQAQIGADIQMVLDVCPPLPSPRGVIETAVERTAAWAERGRAAFLAGPTVDRQHQFGIVQGGTDVDLRRRSAERTTAVDFDGYAIGGLSVGEDRSDTGPALAAVTELLPADQPRYFMGLGDPVGIVEAVARGVDMFDCVLPTRLARHGTMLTSTGRMNLTRAEFATSTDPIDPGTPDSPVARWSRGYLRHLLQVKEPTAPRLLTLHNLHWLFGFVADVRASIVAGQFDAFRQHVHGVWDA